jgi:hypothetical protein
VLPEGLADGFPIIFGLCVYVCVCVRVCVCVILYMHVYCVCTHTHTHTHTLTHTLTHSHTHTLTHTLTHSLSLSHTHMTGLKLTARFMDPGPSGFVDTPSAEDKASDQHGAHALLICGYTQKRPISVSKETYSPYTHTVHGAHAVLICGYTHTLIPKPF